ncbi:hypothetical protein ACU8MP_25465 (plasmid) [Rhizobium leguminosarum]
MDQQILSVRRILILTSHGIRTNAKWQKRLEEIVSAEADRRNRLASTEGTQSFHITVRHNDYRYFSLFSFLNPFRRRSETRKFTARLREYLASDQFDEIHLVGHSFGTHIIGNSLVALGDDLKGKIDTVILAASVLPGTFPWDSLFRSGIRRLVNECGDKDLVLVFNAILPFGSGLAGRRGFIGITGDNFRNRFFSFGHSGYFRKRIPDGPDDIWFMRKFWVPLLLGEQTTPFVDEREDTYSRTLVGWLVDQSENLKWVVPLGFAGIVALVILYLALVWRTNFNLETLEISGQILDAVERRQLNGIPEQISQRQALIDKAANQPISFFEDLIRRDARASFNPPQWERARVAAKLAVRPKRLLTAYEVLDAAPRGRDFVELRYATGSETDDQPNVQQSVFDLNTGSVSQHPMWSWTGIYAGPGHLIAGKASGAELLKPSSRFGLQAKLEERFATSLTDKGLSLWTIADTKVRATWMPEEWNASEDAKRNMLVAAEPCGADGAVLALTGDGQPLTFLPDKKPFRLASPEPLVRIVADRSCNRFAGVTARNALVTWSSPAQYTLPLPDQNVSYLEFSASSDLLLVNSSSDADAPRADLIEFSGSKMSKSGKFDALHASGAAFSPSGKQVVVKQGETCSVHPVAAFTGDADPGEEPFPFTCPKDSNDSSTLAEHVRFLAEDKLVMTTRAESGSFGDSQAEVLSLPDRRSEWLVRASRYDIISLDANSDGSVLTTTSGDSADDGYGADRGFYVWSVTSQEPVFEDLRDPKMNWEARRAWILSDGMRVIVSWRRFEPNSSNFVYETEVVELDPDLRTAYGTDDLSTVAPPKWGVSRSNAELGLDTCPGLSDDAEWSGSSRDANITNGCTAGGALLLGATLKGRSAQLRIFQSESNWALRIRFDDTATADAIHYQDGTVLKDDVTDFVSDPRARRLFLLHRDGSITSLDVGGSLLATRIRQATDTAASSKLIWLDTEQWLRVDTSSSDQADSAVHDLSFYDPAGRLMRRYDNIEKDKVTEGASGVFDSGGQFWTVVDRPVDVPENGQSTASEDKATERELLNLDTGANIPYGCDGEAYSGGFMDDLPTLKISGSGQYLGAGVLAPTVGAAQNNTEMRLFDLNAKRCLGIFAHGGEIYDFAASDDGRLLLTQGLTELNVWHVPTHAVVHAFSGPTRILQDSMGLRIVTRGSNDRPGAVWPMPANLANWLR